VSDWTFYSAKRRSPSAGELLRSIPSRRNLRLDRLIVEGGEETLMPVRAAELLVGIDARLSLQNDSRGALQLQVFEATDEHRTSYHALGRDEPKAQDLRTVARITMRESAHQAGYVDLGDDVLCGLEGLFSGGVGHCPSTGEVVAAKEVVRIMDPEVTPCSHIDLRLRCDEPQRTYVLNQLREMPYGMASLHGQDTYSVFLRGRFPSRLSPEEVRSVCNMALELAKYASSGHVRFREGGVWQEAVEGIGAQVAPVSAAAADASEPKRGMISRLFGRDK